MFIKLLITIIFVAIHISTPYLKVLDKVPRSKFLSASGGIAVSYVFMHILPELSDKQDTVEKFLTNDILKSLESHIYVISLLGLIVFYGLEKMSKLSKESDKSNKKSSKGIFWIHLAFTSIYDAVTVYLLVNRDDDSLLSLILYAIAIGLHFFVVDHGLRAHYKDAYDTLGRWILSFGSCAGFILGYTIKINPLFLSALFAFLVGGIILNILKEELPEERKSSFTAFALGAIAYSILLLFT